MTDVVSVAREIAPTGRLRVAVNHGNVVLVRRRPEDGAAEGVSVDLARALAERLELDVDLVHFEKAGAVTDKADADVWDICFLAVDPKRAEQISFTEPYVVIEGCYLVPMASPAANADDVDHLALRIGVVRGSAYALYLTRAEQGADIVLFPNVEKMALAFERGEVDGLAGVRQAMERHAARIPNCKLLEPPFMEIPQAMGVVAGRPLSSAISLMKCAKAALSPRRRSATGSKARSSCPEMFQQAL